MDLDKQGSYNLRTAHLHTPIAGHEGDRFMWDIEVDLEYSRFSINDSPSPLIFDHDDLWTIGVDLQMMWKDSNSRWSPFLRFSPNISTDFNDGLDSDAFRLNGVVGTFYQASPRLKWIFAVAYQENFDATPVLPFVGFDWQATDSLRFSLAGPRLEMTYMPKEQWSVGLFVEGHSRNWNVEIADQSRNFEVNSARAGLHFNLHLYRKLWLTTETGISFANSIDVQDTSGDTLFEDDADPGFFFNFGVQIPL